MAFNVLSVSRKASDRPDLPVPARVRTINGARVLAEFGDADGGHASTEALAARASGRSKAAAARPVRNNRLADALQSQALSALTGSSGARAYYDRQCDRGPGHHAALRQVSNRLVGILHNCLKVGTLYDEATAWPGHDTTRHASPLAA